MKGLYGLTNGVGMAARMSCIKARTVGSMYPRHPTKTIEPKALKYPARVHSNQYCAEIVELNVSPLGVWANGGAMLLRSFSSQSWSESPSSASPRRRDDRPDIAIGNAMQIKGMST